MSDIGNKWLGNPFKSEVKSVSESLSEQYGQFYYEAIIIGKKYRPVQCGQTVKVCLHVVF